MNRIQKILASARITLADKSKERWKDEDLLSILNEGHKDLCRHTQLLHGKLELFLTEGEPYLHLPDEVWLITRVKWGTKTLNMVSYNQMDKWKPGWEDDEGEPQYFIYDRRNVCEARLYPIPNADIFDNRYDFKYPPALDYPLSSSYGVLADGDFGFASTEGVTSDIQDFEMNELYGAVSYISSFGATGVDFDGQELFGFMSELDNYTFDDLFGITADIYDPRYEDTWDDMYGVIAGFNENRYPLKVYYIRNPFDLATVDDDLETPYNFDTALKYYVVGHAFMNDIDAEYQAKGAQQLAFYERELNVADHAVETDNTRSTQFQTEYRRGI